MESSVAFHLSVYGKIAQGSICKHFLWGGWSDFCLMSFALPIALL